MKCELAKEGEKICPGCTIDGDCLIYSDEGVTQFNKVKKCVFKQIRTKTKEEKVQKLNPLKASKQKFARKGGK